MTRTVEIGHPTPREYCSIGELIYLVDPYIYPPLFGTKAMAVRAMPKLMGIDNSPFKPEYVHVARLAGRVVGVIVAYLHPFSGTPDFEAFYEAFPELPHSCRDVCERYLQPMCDGVTADEVYIPCVATAPQYRGIGVATHLLSHIRDLSGESPLKLDVLKENATAIRLYESLGFAVIGESGGYAFEGVSPVILSMSTVGDSVGRN